MLAHLKSEVISRNVTMCQYLWWFVKILKDLLRSVKICTDPSRSAKISKDLLRSVKICVDLLRSVKICWDLSKYFKIYWNMWRSAGICQNMYMLYWNHTYVLCCGWCPRRVMVDDNGDVYQLEVSECVNEFISVIYQERQACKTFEKDL